MIICAWGSHAIRFEYHWASKGYDGKLRTKHLNTCGGKRKINGKMPSKNICY
jgi:hypothetical protein